MVDRLASQNSRHEKFTMSRCKLKFFGASGDNSASEQLEHVLPSSSVDLQNLQSAKPKVKQSKEDTSSYSLTRNDAKRRLFPKLPLAVARKVRYTKAPPFVLQNRRQETAKIQDQEPKYPDNTSTMAMQLTITTERESASLVRFLIHNTMPYAVRSLLCFVREKGTVADYFNSELCREVFCRIGRPSLPFLENVYRHRVAIMSYYRKIGMYPNIGRRTDYCLACDKTGGRCDCPTLDVSFHLFCRKQCDVGEYLCKCKDWVSPWTHLCYDFFFCDICEKSYKDSSRYKPYP